MGTAKEQLLDTIATLSDEEAERALELIRSLRQDDEWAAHVRKLEGIPGIRVPKKRPHFGPVEPIEGTGIPASQLLIQDRR